MGSAVEVILVEPSPGASVRAMDRIRRLEQRWSRFLPDSDVSRLNVAGGRWVSVSPETLVLLATMQEAVERSSGLYDPTFLFELVELGYDASLDDPSRVSVRIDLPCPGLSVIDAEIDERRRRVRFPAGLAVDPGGIGKGLAADLVVRDLLADGTAGALVGIGGDLFAAGRPPTAEGWPVDLVGHQAPGVVDAGALAGLFVSAGGVATSSTRARRSVRDGVSRHHTIDPSTRRSAVTDVASVTVIADCGWMAEADATASLILGAGAIAGYVEARDVSAVVVRTDGTIDRHGRWGTSADCSTDPVSAAASGLGGAT